MRPNEGINEIYAGPEERLRLMDGSRYKNFAIRRKTRNFSAIVQIWYLQVVLHSRNTGGTGVVEKCKSR